MATVLECRDFGDFMMVDSLVGRDPRRWPFERCIVPSSLTAWNTFGGSQNFRPSVEAAFGNFQFFGELAQVWLSEGLWGNEFGSELYTPSQIAAWMKARQDAGRAQNWRIVHRIDVCLRATWTWLAFLAVPSPITGGKAFIEGGEQRVDPVTSYYPQGLTPAVAGERWNPNMIGQKLLPQMLAWALDWKRRYPKPNRYNRTPSIPEGPPRNGLLTVGGLRVRTADFEPDYNALSLLGLVLRRGARDTRPAVPYESPAPAAPFGLQPAEREVLRGVVRGDLDAAKEALTYFRNGRQPIPLFHAYHDDLVATDKGRMMIHRVMCNGNKPGHTAASILNEGFYSTLRVVPFTKVGAPAPDVEVTDAEVIARLDGREGRMPTLPGRTLWWLTWTKDGVECIGGDLQERL